jgi:hypothetical protein
MDTSLPELLQLHEVMLDLGATSHPIITLSPWVAVWFFGVLMK